MRISERTSVQSLSSSLWARWCRICLQNTGSSRARQDECRNKGLLITWCIADSLAGESGWAAVSLTGIELNIWHTSLHTSISGITNNNSSYTEWKLWRRIDCVSTNTGEQSELPFEQTWQNESISAWTSRLKLSSRWPPAFHNKI